MRDELTAGKRTLSEALERRLDDLPPSLRDVTRASTPERVYDPGNVLILVVDAADGVVDRSIPAATAVELLYVYVTLRSELLESAIADRTATDDLTTTTEAIDRSLLAGDLVLAKVFRTLGDLRVESEVQERCYAIVERATAQIIESFVRREPETSSGTELDQSVSPAARRTGAVFGVAAALGGILGDSDPRSLYQRGVALGVLRCEKRTNTNRHTDDARTLEPSELGDPTDDGDRDEFVARARALSTDFPTGDARERLRAFVEDVCIGSRNGY